MPQELIKVSMSRRIFAGGAQLTLANALARALALLSMPLLTHWLSPLAYGQAALASTLISLISVIGLMGMDMSYARSYLSRQSPSGWAVETFCWRFAIISSLVFGAIAVALWLIHAWQDRTASPSLAWWIFAGTATSILVSMAQTRSRLHELHGRLAIAVAGGGIAATAATLLFSWKVVPDERALVTGYVAAYLVPLAIMGVPSWNQLSSPSKLDVKSRWDVFIVGVPGVVTAPMYWILSSSDRWFLQSFSDTAAVGVYAIAGTFGQLGMMVNSALLAIWLPEATRLHETGDTESDTLLANVMVRLLVIMALVWLAVGVLGGDLVRLLVAEKFHRAADLVPWLAGAVFFYGCYHLANTVLFIGRRLKWSALIWASVGAASMVANAVVVPLFGAGGASIVQCSAFALLAFLVGGIAQMHHPLPLPFGRLAFALAITVGALILGQGLPAVAGFGVLLGKLAFVCIAAFLVVLAAEPDLPKMALRRAATLGVRR